MHNERLSPKGKYQGMHLSCENILLDRSNSFRGQSYFRSKCYKGISLCIRVCFSFYRAKKRPCTCSKLTIMNAKSIKLSFYWIFSVTCEIMWLSISLAPSRIGWLSAGDWKWYFDKLHREISSKSCCIEFFTSFYRLEGTEIIFQAKTIHTNFWMTIFVVFLCVHHFCSLTTSHHSYVFPCFQEWQNFLITGDVISLYFASQIISSFLQKLNISNQSRK